jgi:hypothetical protein
MRRHQRRSLGIPLTRGLPRFEILLFQSQENAHLLIFYKFIIPVCWFFFLRTEVHHPLSFLNASILQLLFIPSLLP